MRRRTGLALALESREKAASLVCSACRERAKVACAVAAASVAW